MTLCGLVHPHFVAMRPVLTPWQSFGANGLTEQLLGERIQDQHHNLGPDPGRVMSMHLFQMYSWRRRISWRCAVVLLTANWTTHIAIFWTEKSLINMCDPGKAVQQVEQGGKEVEEVATNTDLLTADLLTSLCFSVCQPGTSFYLYAFIYKPIIEQLIF